LLKHPLCRLGGAPGALNDAVATLELALLRGTRPQPGSGGVTRDFARFRDELVKLRRGETSSLHAAEPRTRSGDAALDRAGQLILALQAALSPLESLSASKPYDFADLAKRHRGVLIALSGDEHGVADVFEGPQGSALASAFDDLASEQ